MNWEQIEGKWDQFKGDVRSKWAKLTDDDISLIGGKKDKLIGKLKERYGNEKESFEQDVDAWIEGINTKSE